ncbi:MAG: hypothetical protein ABI983_00850 [Acidobacteriota bacterium]
MIGNRFEPLEPSTPGRPIRARDLETAQTVVLHEVTSLDDRLVGVFHPALLAVFAIVEHGGRTLAALESTQARPLVELFSDVPCHARRAGEIVSELADGVAELHARGLCHGSISAATTLLTAKGKAKLSLASAIGGSEHADLKALKLLLCEIGGQLTPAAAGAQSAAVFAASLRTS